MRSTLPLAFALAFAPAALAQGDPPPTQAGLDDRLAGRRGVPTERLLGAERGGRVAVPGDPAAFVRLEALGPSGPEVPLPADLDGLHWPAGLAPAPGTLRVFVQGLNTPRPDDPAGDIGADARLAEYLRQGYLAAPALAVHNATALEEGDAVAPAGLPGFWVRELERVSPVRERDGRRAALLRFTGLGADARWTTAEIARVRDLLVRALGAGPPRQVHLVGYSDGTLVVEHALKLAARDLEVRWGAARVEAELRARVFLEYWGNATPPLVPGPRRLLVHADTDPVTSRVVLGRRMGVFTRADVPPAFRADTVVVTFESHYGGWNAHNALTATGPALAAILRRELGPAVARPSSPVAFADAPTLRLFERLRARGGGGRHYAATALGVDFTRFAPYLWRTGEAARDGQ